MQIKDIMSRQVVLCSPETTLRDAARMMRDHDTGFLPVGDNDRLVGAVTDRDIVIRCVADGKDPDQCLVREAMTEKMVWCFEDEDVSQAAHLMEEKQIRRLPIVSREKRLVGVVSLGDIATKMMKDALSGHTLESISRPTHSWSHH